MSTMVDNTSSGPGIRKRRGFTRRKFIFTAAKAVVVAVPTWALLLIDGPSAFAFGCNNLCYYDTGGSLCNEASCTRYKLYEL